MKRALAILIVSVVAAAGVFGAYNLLLKGPAVKTFELTGFDFGYNQPKGGPTIRVKFGDMVRVSFKNLGGLEHEFMVVDSIKDPKIKHQPIFEGAMIELKPRATGTITFKVDRAGNFFYACFEQDPEPHVNRGMFADFIVEP